MIDTHCHIDLYDNPIEIANECERNGIITIGMTNLPSHFEIGFKHLKSYKKVRLALGLHPLHPELHKAEFPIFLRNIDNTSYIGEIGLDFSKDGIKTKDIQLETFIKILEALKERKKIISLHSRKAEIEVFNFLKEYHINAAIFHWYSGPLGLISKIIDSGFYFSVNTAMIKSKSGQSIIAKIPMEFILTESDGPFIHHNGKPATPNDINIVVNYLSDIWKTSPAIIQSKIDANFSRLLTNLQKFH